MSDTTDLTIVIILLFVLFCYLSYIRNLFDSIYDINNIKCNPVNLFLNSIGVDSADSIDNFAECVQTLIK